MSRIVPGSDIDARAILREVHLGGQALAAWEECADYASQPRIAGWRRTVLSLAVKIASSVSPLGLITVDGVSFYAVAQRSVQLFYTIEAGVALCFFVTLPGFEIPQERYRD